MALDITKLLRNTERLEKQKFACERLITYIFTVLEHEKKDKVQVPHQNKMLSLYCTALGLISKMKTIIPN